jgi:hypothetical protein
MIALGVPPTFAIRSSVLQYSGDWEGNGNRLSRCPRPPRCGLRLDKTRCTNPPRGVRSPLTWARRSVTTTGKSYTDADLITAVANLAFDGIFRYRCSL